jgi:alkyldihydroxyacetonephosphate synthase
MDINALSAPTIYPLVQRELCDLLGELWVSTRWLDRLAYSYDVWPVVRHLTQQGQYPYWPDMIVWPETAQQVSAVLKTARFNHIVVVPYAGGSGAVGGVLQPRHGITLDIKRMDHILSIDATSLTVTVEAGVLVQKLEDTLNRVGFTLGHFPQSMHSAAVGGSIAHNGIGTFSTKYGKFDDMLLGMQVVIPNGDIVDILPVPKRSTGPNLNELFLGSEGTLGVVTQATLKIHPLPETRTFQAYAVPDMRKGLDVIRQIIQHDLKPAVVRLYDEHEGKGLIFESVGLQGGQCLLIVCFEGFRPLTELEASLCSEICRFNGLSDMGPEPGLLWFEKKRFDIRHYLSATTKPNRIAETLEVAATWDTIADLYYAIRKAMEQFPCRSMGHLSHVYPQGANLYMIFFAEAAGEQPETVQELYYQILNATFQTCHRLGGTISHHHGIGISKKQWMVLEHGETGMRMLDSIKKALDPDLLMNPGKLGIGE